ncbi:hypothetical protein RJ639_009015 [Escallonia herrerae]|uniref:Retrotransposon gag domain-containing protein n=1 Tax=Escallonia herrerae TaxID=1293975 RepID=A0AA88VS96_9ASTE|nr:hypothetical protein RJ639_009015 [Escallonia herrerae]
MAVAPSSTYHSHLDPGDLRLRLTSRSSYGHKYQSTADPTYNHKDKSGDRITRSGSCYRHDSSVEASTTPFPHRLPKLRHFEDLSTERGSLSFVPEDETLGRLSLDIVIQNNLSRGKNLDIREHVYQFQTNMLLLQVSDAVMCRAFPTTLRKAAHAWFKSLQPRSIYSFVQLSDLFQKHFVSSRSRRKNSASLLNIVQEKNESLACFLGRFNPATLEIDNLDESMKYTAFLRGLRPTSKFAFSVKKSPPGNMKALLEKANKYIQAEEYLETHRDRRGEGKPEQKKRSREVTPPEGKSAKRPKRDERRPKDTFNLTPLNASSAEILFHDAFKKMNIPTERLRKMDTPLYGFFNHPVTAEGIIALPVAIGTPPAQANFMLDFVVVRVPSAYNAILGRPALNKLQAVVSTYHLKMKFPTEHGIGEVKGDQTTARQCYVTSCRSKNKEALIIEDLQEDSKMQRGEPIEDLVSIEVYPGEENKTVHIGSNLKEDTKLKLVNLLRTYADIFAWTAADMPGIDPKIITHRLNVDPTKKRVKQKKRTFAPERQEKIEEEEDGLRKPIYYVSKVLQDVETRYPKIDKIALALIISARRLRPYFQSHTIVVLTDQPLRKVLLSPEASGRLVNWSVELGEFDLQYKPRTAIKAQALADFIVECTLPEDPPQLVISEVTDP